MRAQTARFTRASRAPTARFTRARPRATPTRASAWPSATDNCQEMHGVTEVLWAYYFQFARGLRTVSKYG